MEKTYRNGHSRTRKRLVTVFILLYFYIPAFIYPLETLKSFENKADKLALMHGDEIQSFRSTGFHQSLFSYLFFIPGPCVLLILLFNKKIKKPAFLIFLILISVSGKWTHCNREHIEKGWEYFYSGSITDALASFKIAEETYGKSPGISYNTALCYYKLGNKGLAVSELFKALKMAPMNNRIKTALKIIEEKSNLTSQIAPRPFLNPDIPFLSIIIFFNLSCIFLGLVFIFRKGQLVIIFIFLALCVTGSLAFFIFTQAQLNEKIGIIVESSAMLKKIPLSTSKTWLNLKEGVSLIVLGKAKEYLLVKTGRGIKGWVMERSLKLI